MATQIGESEESVTTIKFKPGNFYYKVGHGYKVVIDVFDKISGFSGTIYPTDTRGRNLWPYEMTWTNVKVMER